MSVELKGQVNSFLKRAFKCGFCSKLYTIEAIADDADIDLCRKMVTPCHCIHCLLPPVKSYNHYLRPKGHTYALPRYDSEIHKKSFAHVASLSTYNVFILFMFVFAIVCVYTFPLPL